MIRRLFRSSPTGSGTTGVYLHITAVPYFQIVFLPMEITYKKVHESSSAYTEIFCGKPFMPAQG